VCRALDGLPLGIELAAAQVRGLAPEQMAGLLDERLHRFLGPSRSTPSRHRTLQATIDWSYALLSTTEQILLDRLGVFAGGWSLEAAEAVVADDQGLREREVLPVLLRLVDRSLVVVEPGKAGEPRYRLLETVRQYALDRLAARGDAECRCRHAAYFLALAGSSVATHRTSDERAAFDRLEREHDNLRATLSWLLAQGNIHVAMRLGESLFSFWLHRGHIPEGRAWMRRLLCLPGSEQPIRRQGLLYAAGFLALYDGDLPTAEAQGRESLALAHEVDDQLRVSRSLTLLGAVARVRGEYAVARVLHGKGVLAAQMAASATADYADAGSRGPEMLVELANLWMVARAACGEGDYAFARVRAEEARVRSAKAGYTVLLAQSLKVLGLASYMQGEYAAARPLLEQSVHLLEANGAIQVPDEPAVTLGCVERDAGELAQAASRLSENLTIFERIGARPGIAHCLDAIAGLLVACGQPDSAVRLAGSADTLYEHLGCDPKRAYRFGLDPWLKSARQLLGAGRADEEYNRGRELTRSAAIAEALALAAKLAIARANTTDALLNGSDLTRRERQVAGLISRGMTNREIAEALVIAERTAEHHVENLLSKLGFESRRQVARWAAENAWPAKRV
jgi:non-specific serine/threonine protein kinase